MKILLINISLRPDSTVTFPPIGLGYIASAIHNAGYAFDLLDLDVYKQNHEIIEEKIRHTQYDVVLMGCIVTGYRMIREISARIKKINRKTIIVAGNTVASSIPDHLLTHTGVDMAVLGEGDETVIDLLKLLESGDSLRHCKGIVYKSGTDIVYTEKRPPIKDLDLLPFINWDLFNVEKYIEGYRYAADESIPLAEKDIRMFSTNSARGCIHRCSFCYHAFNGYPYRRRSNKSILDEVQLLIDKYGINTVQFNDDLTFFSKKNLAEFADLIIERRMKFYWRGTCCSNLFQDDGDIELAKKMFEAGCTSLCFSLESADMEILKAMRKHHTPEQFLKQAEILQKAGIVCMTSLVFGYPAETKETIKKTIDCCIKAKIYPSVGYLLPQPGSWAFDYAVKKGYIQDIEEYLLILGDRQDLRINMTEIPDDEFENLVQAELHRCNEMLNVGLSANSLIKTTKYRKAKISC